MSDNPKWLQVIRAQYCLVCGTTPCDAHHVGNGGMSKKAPDIQAIPLCHKHHMAHHTSADPSPDQCREWLGMLWDHLVHGPRPLNYGTAKPAEDYGTAMDRHVRILIATAGQLEAMVRYVRTRVRIHGAPVCGMCGTHLRPVAATRSMECPDCTEIVPW